MNENEFNLSAEDIEYVVEHLVQNPKEIKIEYDPYQLQTHDGKLTYNPNMYKPRKSLDGYHEQLAKDFKDMKAHKDRQIEELKKQIEELIEENNELKIELETFKAMEN